MKIQEAYRTRDSLDPKKQSSCHIIIKTLNIQSKERILRATKEKGQVTYKGRLIRITSDFSLETMKARRQWSSVMQTLKDHRCQHTLLYPAKLSITVEEKKTRYSMTKPDLTNTQSQTQSYTKYQKENFNSRKLATSTKTQTIEGLTAANPKEGKDS